MFNHGLIQIREKLIITPRKAFWGEDVRNARYLFDRVEFIPPLNSSLMKSTFDLIIIFLIKLLVFQLELNVLHFWVILICFTMNTIS